MDDFWKTAVEKHIVPLQEWLMQGSVMNNYRETLNHRLQGLCDNTETGIETFNDHQMVYTLKNNEASITLHVRRALNQPEMPWHIRYLGTDMNKDDRILVRTCLEAGVSSNIQKFLMEMGFRLDFEYIARGYLFRRGKMKVTISTIFKMTVPGNVEELEQVSLSHLVELSVVTTDQENIAQDMKTFADELKPLIQLEKVDHRTLANRAHN